MKKNPMMATIAAFLFVALMASCKKSSDSQPTRTEMMVGTWNLNAYGQDDNGDGLLQASEYDPIPAGAALQQTYRADGTGVFMTQGPGSAPTYTNINWSLTDNEQNLRVQATGGATTNATIAVLTQSQLQGYDPAQSPRYIYVLTK
jgi:hypothetical protein